MRSHSRFKRAKVFLIFWCLFIGIGAVGGASCMLIKPDGSLMGMQDLLPFFQVLPFADILFQDYVFPGIALLLVNGIPNLIASVLIMRNKKSGLVMGGVLGLTLMAWICIQFVIFPMNFMDIAYFTFGVLQAVTGYAAWIFFCQEHFPFDSAVYKSIGSDPKKLVVYFSRMGYTRKIAYETADKLGAVICEIKCKERTEGTLGFLWCGRYGMHRWAMPTEDISAKLDSYDKVTICTPIWVFTLAAPVRNFCKKASGKIKSADYILVHHQGSRYMKAAEEMDKLLCIRHGSFRSIKCHVGKYKEL